MAPFYVLGCLFPSRTWCQAYRSEEDATGWYVKNARSYPAVLYREPGHEEITIREDSPEKMKAVREGTIAALEAATQVFVMHRSHPIASIYGAKEEAFAARMFSYSPRSLTKVMWCHGHDQPIHASGDEEKLKVSKDLARDILGCSKVGEGASHASGDSPSEEEENPSSNEVKLSCWMVGSEGADGLRLKAYLVETPARRAWASLSRDSPTVLILQPGNNVIDSAGDDEAVQAVKDDIAAVAANATCAVARYTNHTSANVHVGDNAEADARREYASISDSTAKAIWIAGQDSAAATSGIPRLAKLCSKLAHQVVQVAAAAEGSTTAEDGSELPETDIPEATYWLIGRTLTKTGMNEFKAFATAADSVDFFNKSKKESSAALIMSNPWSVALENWGDWMGVEELRVEMSELTASVHRVVAWHQGDHAEAKLYNLSEVNDAHTMYGSLPLSHSRVMWTADEEIAILSAGSDQAGKAAANKLAQAILSIAESPESVPEPIRYYTVAVYKNDEVYIKAYATEANARLQYKRLGSDLPRALAGQPGNRTIESSPGDMDASILPKEVFRVTRKTVETVRWVMVRRAWKRVEAPLRSKNIASKEAAVATYDRIKGRGARGVWGADEPEAIKSNGYPSWLGRCENLAMAILGKKVE